MSYEHNPSKPPVAFWVISVIGLLWNLMGCFQWFTEYNFWKNPETRDILPEAMRGLYDQTPAWTYIIFAIAVIAGTLGCIGLLMRKSWATTLFMISLIAVIIQQVYYLISTDTLERLGPTALIMPLVITLFAGFLLYYSKKSTAMNYIS